MEFVEERMERSALIGKYVLLAAIFLVGDAGVLWALSEDGDIGSMFSQLLSNFVILLISLVFLLQLWGVNLLINSYRNAPPLRRISMSESAISLISGLVHTVIFFKDVVKLKFDEAGTPVSMSLKDGEVIHLPKTENNATFAGQLRAKLAHAL